MQVATTTYVAVPGDYLVKIARAHGTTWQDIWNHPLNAGHRAKRKSPDALRVGDVLHIPVSPTPPHPVAPPSVPPLPLVPPRNPRWPYTPVPIIDEALKTKPSWDCPGGTCVCHPGSSKPNTLEHVIFLHDEQSRRMPGALCRAHMPGGGAPRVLTSDGAGAVQLELPTRVGGLFLEWGTATPTGGQEPFRRAYRVGLGDGVDNIRQQLAHVGVSSAPSLVEQIYDFQLAYRLPPYDGEASSLAPILHAYHSTGCLPPLPLEDGPELVVPLPPDIRSTSQGAVSGVRRPNPAWLRVQLVDPGEVPLADTSFKLILPLGKSIAGATTAAGHIDVDDVPLGDHRVELERTTIFASASSRLDPTRRVLVVF